MRDKLNKDPKAQIALVALLVVAAAFVFMKSAGGGSETEEAATTEATVAVAGTSATATATGATAGEAVEGAVEGAVESAAAEASAAAAVVSSIKAPPPPQPVRQAYADGKTVVLLIVHDGGIDDALVALASRSLTSMEDVALFVVPASQIYRYSAITLGVEVSRVPALVVMRPHRLSEGTPQATVTYGFQTEQGVVQAVRDASYDGPPATYHPG